MGINRTDSVLSLGLLRLAVRFHAVHFDTARLEQLLHLINRAEGPGNDFAAVVDQVCRLEHVSLTFRTVQISDRADGIAGLLGLHPGMTIQKKFIKK